MMIKPSKQPKYDLKVLLCEDSRNTLNSLNSVLLHRFSEVIIAEDGLIGLSKYESEKPNLIITDIKMPRVSGLEMIKKIREIDNSIKIIIISAHTDINYFMEAIDFHISAFINKPVDLRVLDSHLNEISADILLCQRTRDAEKKQVAIQKEQERLYQEIKQDLALARSVQEYLLPEWLLFDHELIFSTAYVPSKDVGGDLFGYYPITKDSFVFYLGDVSGHGLKAAMLMMAANSTINMLIEQRKPDISPAELLTALNRILCKHLFIANNYMTIILGTINLSTNCITYIRAGHPEIIVFDHHKNKATLLDTDKGTIPVGWLPTHQYTAENENTLCFEDHQTIFIYSDGLYECNLPDGSRLGQQALLKEMNAKIPKTDSITASLEFMEHIKQAGYDLSQDDFTLVSFFKPYSASITGLKQFFQADIPDNMELEKIECGEFLSQFTEYGKFPQFFERDINLLFSSESFQGERNFISGFILLLVYKNDIIECHFWLKSPQNNEYSNRKPITKHQISAQISSLDIKKDGYLKEVKYKTLGDILQVICVLNPTP